MINTTQRYILLYGAIGELAIFLFPPWRTNNGYFSGYGFFFSLQPTNAGVDCPRLFLGIVLVALATFVAWMIESIVRQ